MTDSEHSLPHLAIHATLTARLARFGAMVLRAFQEVDRVALRDDEMEVLALACGALRKERRTVPCSQDCWCAKNVAVNGDVVDCLAMPEWPRIKAFAEQVWP